MTIKKVFIPVLLACFSFANCTQVTKPETEQTLKNTLKGKFRIGAALNDSQFAEKDSLAVAVIQKQFNAIVAENCMKSRYLQPEEGKFFFDEADKFVAFGEANNLWITGHCLVWHSQISDWFFIDAQGNDVSRETLIERMKNHITTVVSRYKGRIKGWDVVNEAILDDGSWRESKFYKIIGEDFVKLAFQFAHEADPDAELYYNDYSMANEGKRQGVVKLVKQLKEQGIRIDAVGMQGHLSMDYPSVEEFEKSLLAFSETGVKVMITELDLSILPNPKPNIGADVATSFEYRNEMNPYTEGLPADIEAAWSKRYLDFFRLFLKHGDKVSRVTLWGVCDADSWKNNWPVPGRTDYPLLFNRSYQAKPIVNQIIQLYAEKNP
jgi:endo-1,4-beta-xylanase